MDEREIFLQALEITDPAARTAFLDNCCAGQPELRLCLDELLLAHERAAQFLEPSVIDDSLGPTAAHEPLIERPGTVIAAKYKLLQKIGEGGMGSVWMADQLEPVKRRLAIKLIRAEREGSRSILARFEAERQAIALMDHPHIAKLLDAGTTRSDGTGRPFFVMELVKGAPLIEFCDEHKLSLPARLQLFVQICSAVQHAHQKGIIHRDLKPTNILVEMHDHTPVPKVIDFGLAKAMSGQPLTEHTLFTGFGTVAGTPLYMAPEQAKFNAIDVDTRADVFSLGVILYELLTGSTPIERASLKQAALDEVLRVIRESDPPIPSKRISSSQSRPAIAANRGIELTKLGRFLRGDLDWIVMKALSKERDRRYETANAFAKDIERFLNRQPVQAGPPTWRYKLRKFVARNKLQVGAAALVLLALILGIIGTTFGLFRAEIRRAEAEQAKINEQKQRAIAVAQKNRAEQAELQMLEDYRAATDDAIEQLIGSKPELGPKERLYLENTLKRWQKFADRQGDDERSLAIRGEGHFRVAMLWAKLGDDQKSHQEWKAAREIHIQLVERSPTAEHRYSLANTRANLGIQLSAFGAAAEGLQEIQAAERLLKELVTQYPGKFEYQHSYALAHNHMANSLEQQGDYQGTRLWFADGRDYLKALVSQRFTADPELSDLQFLLAGIQMNLGMLLNGFNEDEEAQRQVQEAIVLYQDLVKRHADEPDFSNMLAGSHLNFALLLTKASRYKDAFRQRQTALDIRKQLYEQYPAVAEYQLGLMEVHQHLAGSLQQIGRFNEALAELEAARDIGLRLTAKYPMATAYLDRAASACGMLARLSQALGRMEQALQDITTARDLQLKLAERNGAAHHQEQLARILTDRAAILKTLGRLGESRADVQASLDILTQLVEHDDGVPGNRDDLAQAHEQLAQILAAQQEFATAFVEFETAEAMARALVDEFPKTVSYRSGLGGYYCNHGIAVATAGELDDSLKWFQLAISTLEEAQRLDAASGEVQLFLRNSHWSFARTCDDLGKYADAAASWARAAELSPADERPVLQQALVYSQIRAGMFTAAVQEIDKLKSMGALPSTTLFDFARYFASASRQAGDQQQQYADYALILLQQAVAAGFDDGNQMAKDSDLDSLRERNDFKQLLESLQNK